MATEQRLVDANALEKDIFGTADMYKTDHLFIDVITYAIENAPTVDAVEVVRCKECRHSSINENHPNKPLICYMTKKCGTTAPDWFCADGERRK